MDRAVVIRFGDAQLCKGIAEGMESVEVQRLRRELKATQDELGLMRWSESRRQEQMCEGYWQKYETKRETLVKRIAEDIGIMIVIIGELWNARRAKKVRKTKMRHRRAMRFTATRRKR